jgi:hypothetical protein
MDREPGFPEFPKMPEFPKAPEFPKTDVGHAVILYMISVYLLLIAFFVILHTVSGREAGRQEAVLGSLHGTFQSVAPAFAAEPSAEGEGVRDFLKRRLGPALTALDATKTGNADLLRMAIDPDAFFYGGTASIRSDREDVVKTLSGVLEKPAAGRRNTVEIWVGLGADETLALHRAGTLARAFEDDGVNAGLIAIGALDGPAARLEIALSSETPDLPPRDGGAH